MITNVMRLTLIHPLLPVRSWTFYRQPIIRIGRCPDNDVVLYSSVVSRYHVELKSSHENWEIINLGRNGTYIDGKPITKVKVVNGLIINLALIGPKVALHLLEQSNRVNVKQRQNNCPENSLNKLEVSLLRAKFEEESKEQELFENTESKEIYL